MPYPNLPKSLWPQMERCVEEVRKKGNVDNPYAVCYSSISQKLGSTMKKKAKQLKGRE